MLKRLRLTRREHKSRRAEGKPHIELNVCWKWYIYPGQRQHLNQVLKTAQQQLEDILCLPSGTVCPTEVREIGQKNDRVLDRLDVLMSNRALAVDLQLPGFNDMLDGVMQRSQINLIERINTLEGRVTTQQEELENQRRDSQNQQKELENRRRESQNQQKELDNQIRESQNQRKESENQLRTQRERSEQTRKELQALEKRVKAHDEALDRLFCGQLAYEVDNLARKVVYGDPRSSKLTLHELLADKSAQVQLQGLCNNLRAVGLSIKNDVDPCLRSLKEGRILNGHPNIVNFKLNGRSVEDVLTEWYPKNATVMVEIIKAIKNAYSHSYTPLSCLTV